MSILIDDGREELTDWFENAVLDEEHLFESVLLRKVDPSSVSIAFASGNRQFNCIKQERLITLIMFYYNYFLQ